MPWRGDIDTVGLEACPFSEWLHRRLVEAGFNAVCVEVRHAQRFLSTRPVKTDRDDACGLAVMTRVGHYCAVHVKASEAQHIRTVLQARRQIVELHHRAAVTPDPEHKRDPGLWAAGADGEAFFSKLGT